MSDIQEEQKRLYKRAEENDLTQIAYKMTENTLLMKQAGDKAINKINELQEENKKLKELCDKYEEEHKTTFEEWKKDINIIDELEKYLIEMSDRSWDDNGAYDDVLNKLNELKGDNK